MQFRYSEKMKRYEICRKRLEGVYCKCAGWKPRRHCAGRSLTEETFYIKKSWLDIEKPIVNFRNEYAEVESSKWQVQQMIKICSPFLIGLNHDEENLVEARIWESLQERNFRKVHSGANSQISWGGGQNLLWRWNKNLFAPSCQTLRISIHYWSQWYSCTWRY